jgi:hypothetical protein
MEIVKVMLKERKKERVQSGYHQTIRLFFLRRDRFRCIVFVSKIEDSEENE